MGAYRSPLMRVLVLALAAMTLVFVASRWQGDIEVGALGLPSDPSGTTSAESGSEPIGTPVDRGALVCPGPERVGLADSAVLEGKQAVTLQARAAPSDALPDSISASTEATTEPDPGADGAGDSDRASGRIEVQTVDGTTVASTDRREPEVAAVVQDGHGAVVAATGPFARGLSAAQIYRGDQDGQVGLALTSCQEPRAESWLIAGGGQAGHAERLVLLNPGQSAITAEVTILGSALDPSEGQAGTEVVVEPGAREILLLDALAPGEAAPVVRVVSSGGPVSAFLGDHLLEGTTDQGTEVNAPVAAPATTQVIVGFDVPAGAADSATVRVAVPGEEQAVIEVHALTAAGSAPLAHDATLVDGQRSADIAVSDLPEGTYALAISSDEAFVTAAQVRSSADGQGRRDVAWAPAAVPLGALAGTPLPQVAQRPRVDYALDLFAPLGGTVRLISMDVQGATRETVLEVSPGQVLTRDLGSATGVWMVPDSSPGQMYAAVRGEAQVASRPADDALTLDGGATSTQTPDEEQDRARLISVLPLRELGLFRSVATLTPALP